MYYLYRQNNSYGISTPPARNVAIEAADMPQADNKFLTIDGCYFDPNYNIDCPCCGQRWGYSRECSDKDLEEAVISEGKLSSWSITRTDIPSFYILRSDGKVDIIE